MGRDPPFPGIANYMPGVASYTLYARVGSWPNIASSLHSVQAMGHEHL